MCTIGLGNQPHQTCTKPFSISSSPITLLYILIYYYCYYDYYLTCNKNSSKTSALQHVHKRDPIRARAAAAGTVRTHSLTHPPTHLLTLPPSLPAPRPEPWKIRIMITINTRFLSLILPQAAHGVSARLRHVFPIIGQ